jgi:hypothetical protein
MKTKRLLLPIAVLLILALAVQGSLSIVSQARAQAAPSAGLSVFLPLLAGGRTPFSTVFGIGVGGLTPAKGLSNTQNANPTWIRQDGLIWSKIEPTKGGGYDWSSASALEADMIQASQLGYKWIQVVRGTPDWAQKYPGTACGPIKQSEFASYADFLKAAIERYSVPPYNAMYWELYNEPDVAPASVEPDSGYGCWGDSSQPDFGGQYFGSMLQYVIPIMRQTNPNIKILNGGLLMNCNPSLTTCQDKAPASFLQGMAKSGAISQLDYLNFHGYDYQGARLGVYGNGANWGTTYQTDPVLVAKVAFIRNVLSQYGLANMPLMNSEVALLKTGNVTCDTICEQNKVMYIGQVYPAAIAQGLVANIWFQASNSWNNSGLYGGPMYDAFTFARNELQDAYVTRKITEFDSSSYVTGYELNRGDKMVWVLWSHDLQNHTINLPGTPMAVFTWTPNTGPYVSGTPSASQVVGIYPVYLEWSK